MHTQHLLHRAVGSLGRLESTAPRTSQHSSSPFLPHLNPRSRAGWPGLGVLLTACLELL